jgi:hypothetical protein
MTYFFGDKSKANLVGVEPSLIAVTTLAISMCKSDFSVFAGVRSQREQNHLVAKGVSKSSNSYHLYGLAVDLVPYFEGRNWWDSPDKKIQQRIDQCFLDITEAMNQAKEIVGIEVDNGFKLWGWDKPHWQRTGWRQKYDIRNLKHNL